MSCQRDPGNPGDGYGNAQSAGTRNDHDRDRPDHGGFNGQARQKTDPSGSDGKQHHQGHEPAEDTIGFCFQGNLFPQSFFHNVDHLPQGRSIADALGTGPEGSLQDPGSAPDSASGFDSYGESFTGERRFVNRARTVEYPPVCRDNFIFFYPENVSALESFHRDITAAGEFIAADFDLGGPKGEKV